MSLDHRRARAVRVGMLALVLAATAVLGVPSASHASYRYGKFTFDKNPDDPTNSRLIWSVYEDDFPNPIAQRVWRAGSGDGASRNECASRHGWLPNGWYRVTLHPRYEGSLIKGVAFQLDDKTCSDGRVTRTELFVHSEMRSDGSQGCPEERRCWEGDKDYRSEGCIKLHPDDLEEAAAEFTRYHTAEIPYDGMLHVVD